MSDTQSRRPAPQPPVWTPRRRRPAPLALAAGIGALSALLGAGAALGLTQGSYCVDASNGTSNNCTSNDVTFVLVGLGVQGDGCTNNNDTVSISLQAVVRNTTAQTRYDIGLWVNNDGTSAKTGGATTCARDRLQPVATLNDTTCGAGHLNLTGGSGPFLNQDGDSCGDLFDGGASGTGCSSPWPDSVYNFPAPIVFPCRDPTNSGFVSIPTCATWGNQNNEVSNQTGANAGQCLTDSDLIPGTKAKCNCADSQTTIPSPRLGLSCVCSPSTVRQNASTSCKVTFNNNISCTPNLSTAERFRCGVASFLRFKAAYDATKGLVFTTSETTGGTIADSGSVLTWTPKDLAAQGGSLGVIAGGETGSMTFQYYVNPTAPNGAANVAVSSSWSDNSSFSPEVSQAALTTTCAITVSDQATYAAVTNFAAREESGHVVATWDTAAEIGTLAFELERFEPSSGRFLPVSRRLLPAVQQVSGGHYRALDAGAPPAGTARYRVVEVEAGGKRHTYGPFTVAVAPAGEQRLLAADRDFHAQAKAPAARLAGIARRAAAAAGQGPHAGAATNVVRVKIETTAEGAYRLPAAALAAALGDSPGRVAADLANGRYRLAHAGAAVAWQAADDGDGLVFYAQALASPFTARNVYWLERGAGTPMATRSAAPALPPAAAFFHDVAHLETDSFPSPYIADPRGDFWFWKAFLAGDPDIGQATLAVDVQDPAAAPASVAVNLLGFEDDQAVELRWNGVSRGVESWTGAGAHTATFALPAGALHAGSNQVELVAQQGIFLLDSFDVAYARGYRAAAGALRFRGDGNAAVAVGGFATPAVALYDLADPLRPVRLSGVAAQASGDGYQVAFAPAAPGEPYLAVGREGLLAPAAVTGIAASRLRDGGNAASYVVLTTTPLLSAAQRLADLRSRQGLSTMVVDVAEVMNEFGDGIYDPEAIRTFLRYASQRWQAPPRYVVLAGKGTYDPRDLLGYGNNVVPVMLASTPDGLVPADGSFGDLDGDGLPDLAVGRIPVVTAAELTGYVGKLAAYESAPAAPWLGRATFAADAPDAAAGDFAATSTALAQTVAARLAVDRVDLAAGSTAAELDAARAELFAAMRAGRLLLNYVGHGGLDRLSSQSLLATPDVGQLANGARLPLMTAFTCNIGLFAYPSVSSLGEELVLQADGGTSALFGPVGLSLNDRAQALGSAVLGQIVGGGGRLGDRLLRGESAFVAAGGDRHFLSVYTLLGDPALVLPY